MQDISHWQSKIVEKRKQTSFRDFVRDICSWSPLTYSKNQEFISIFPPTERIGPLTHCDKYEDVRQSLPSLEIEKRKEFFSTFGQLFAKTPLPSVRHYFNCPNSEFSDTNAKSQNLYLTRCSTKCNNVINSLVIKDTQDVFHSVKVQGGEGSIYGCASVDNSFKIFYSKCIENSSNIWFSQGLLGCHECIFCSQLKNQSYCINDKQYSQTEYFERKEKILSQKQSFYEWGLKVPGESFKNIFSENIQDCIGSTSVKNGKNGFILGNPVGTENMYDVIMCGTSADYYAVSDSGALSQQIYCSNSIVNSSSIFYSIFLESCSFCLGCVGLKNKSYCIFNTQYTKEQWYDLAHQIFSEMDEQGILGEFFPGSINPFYFNDTVAGLIGDFKKEDVTGQGYMWRDGEVKVDILEGSEVIQVSELENYQGFDETGKWYIDPVILEKVIQDNEGNYYRIVQMEYDFLLKHGLPLPEIHWLERMKLNLRFQ